MKNLFVIQNVSPFYSSTKPDSKYLKKGMEQFSGINCTVTFKKVVDPATMTVEEDSSFMNVGNTNPKGIMCFQHMMKGLKRVPSKDNPEKELIFMDSDKLVKGGVVELDYEVKTEGARTHLVPNKEAKFVRHVKMDKIKKTEDKITTLF